MPRPTSPFSPLHLRHLLIRSFSSHPHHFPHPQTSTSKPFFSPPTATHIHRPTSPFGGSLPFSLSSYRTFLSDVDTPPNPFEDDPEVEAAQSISSELLKGLNSDSVTVPQRLDLSFSHVSVTDSLIERILAVSPDAGRAVLGFFKWACSRPDSKLTDDTFALFVDYFGRRKDFKAAHDVLVDGRGISGPKTLKSAVDRLVRAGRPTQVVAFFDKMEGDYGFVRNLDSLKLVVSKLCEHGFASYAEKMVKNLAREFFPDEYICDVLIKGWCVDGKLDEARRLADEMHRGGFDIGPMAYNAMLDCVCAICRKNDPFRLHSEAENVLFQMEAAGVPRNVETFNVLISNLCKIRKTEDAMKLFGRMGEWGCFPNETTFLLLIRSLYQAARIGEGDEMIDKMKSAGFGDALDKQAYYGFLKILCGIERIDHALSVFAKMKEDGWKPGIKTFDLLMGKLCAHGRLDKANALYKEAESSGVPVTPKAYRVDPRFAKKPKAVKKETKRETLPEKMARKRRSLKKLRLSYVKKPKRNMYRAM